MINYYNLNFFLVSAFVFASGLAAMSAVVQLLTSGDHILAGDELYGGSSRLLDTLATHRAGASPSATWT